MAKQFFITGTDTDAGKTFCACVLAKKFREAGLQVRPYKPIVAGFENGHNSDLDSHIRACGLPLKPHDITTFAYQEAIAPHIAAEHENNPIDFKQLDLDLHKAVNSGADVVIMEGAGGWFLPVSSTAVLPQWDALKKMEIIIVVGMKLGCLNHALMTATLLDNEGFRVVGFIANTTGPEKMPFYQENLETLKQIMPCPFIGEVFYNEEHDFSKASETIDLSVINADYVCY